MRRWLEKMIFGLALGGFVGCAGILGWYYGGIERTQQSFEALRLQKEERISLPSDSAQTPRQNQKEQINDGLDLSAINPDYVGWLTIQESPIDYPVVQRKTSSQYYLHRDFYGNYAYSGTPFLESACEVEDPTKNLVIYGHNMKNYTMFGSLKEYTDPGFLEKHPVIHFQTTKEKGTYRIFAVLQSEGSRDLYNLLGHINQGKGQEDFVKGLQEASLYQIQGMPNGRQQLLFLVTCSQKGRLIVAAYKE